MSGPHRLAVFLSVGWMGVWLLLFGVSIGLSPGFDATARSELTYILKSELL